jgi:hypothetical protein
MMLLRTPPCICPIVTMAGWAVMSTWRLTIVWSPSTTCDATTIGSTPAHGAAPCVCRPRSVMSSTSAAAMNGPLRHPTWPDGTFANTCRPKTAFTSGFFSTPSLTISSAPAGRSACDAPSSAGWKMKTIVPRN